MDSKPYLLWPDCFFDLISKIDSRPLSVLVVFLLSMVCSAQSSFEFEGEQVKPGSKKHFEVPIQVGIDSTFIPITVFNGRAKGPVMGITTGVHGFEYPPIMAGQKLIQSLDVNVLKGTVILVQIANLPSFRARSPFVNLVDGKNLNRSFPGSDSGTLTERIANFISTKVISRSDFFLDAHAGDAPEDLMPYGAYYHNDEKPAVSQKGREMAIAMGFDSVIIFDTTGKGYLKKGEKSLYCSAEAFKNGIPSVDIECGGLGRADTACIDKIVEAVLNLLTVQDMYDRGQVSRKKKQPKFCKDRFSLKSGETGIFYSNKKAGDQVRKGEELGYTTDFFGRTVKTHYAPESGTILYMVGTPPINKGETLFSIGQFQ